MIELTSVSLKNTFNFLSFQYYMIIFSYPMDFLEHQSTNGILMKQVAKILSKKKNKITDWIC